MSCDVPSDELDADGILDGQAMRLALDSSLVDDDSSVGSETYRTGTKVESELRRTRRNGQRATKGGKEGKEVELTSEGETNVIVQHGHLSNGSGILKLKSGLLLYSENDAGIRFDSDLQERKEKEVRLKEEGLRRRKGRKRGERTAAVPLATASRA